MENLKEEISSQIKTLRSGGTIEECKKLNSSMKKKDNKYRLYERSLPMHFSGDLDSNIVFVELNPGKGDLKPTVTDSGLELKGFKNNPTKISNLEDYLHFFSNLGVFKAEDREDEKNAVSGFDQKQWFFLRGFGLFGLTGEKPTHSDTKKIRSEVLQLEIVPFMSERFDFNNFKEDYIIKRVNRTKEIIESKKRKVVFIVGGHRCIDHVFGINKTEKYRIDGRKTQVKVGYTKIDDTSFFLLKTYKAQGFTGKAMENYGILCRKILEERK